MKSLIEFKKATPVLLVWFALVCFSLSPSAVTGTRLAVSRPEGSTEISHPAAAGLTFAERAVYQRIIEDVYWRHRIWPKENPDPKPSLDAVMSQAQLEDKVTGYVRQSLMLQDNWQRPITAEQLQAEINRMARDTKQPEVLRELFEALGNDPAVIAECLAKPILAERLIADLSLQDKTRHFESPQADGLDTTSVATTLEQVAYTLPQIAVAYDPPCTGDTWTAMSTTNAPSARSYHTAVWTGSEMIVWGGGSYYGVSNTGGRYSPSTDSWSATSTTNAPSPRAGHSAVWTGSEMIIWSGEGDPYPFPGSGGRYNPSTDSWTATSTTNAPEHRLDHSAVWTGSEMIVWSGGYFVPDGGRLVPVFSNTGGRYNPNTDSWTATSTTNAPSPREYHRAVWTGSEMIVWGGELYGFSNTGGRYNPSTDSWTATNTTNAPEARSHFTAVWTGSEMIVWGGYGDSLFNTGGRYNPSTNSWTATRIANAPSARYAHTAVWTRSEMIIWGGGSYNGLLNSTGGRYNPTTDSWTATNLPNRPHARRNHTAIWTGSEMIVWGGYYTDFPGDVLNTGGRYCAPSGTLSYDFNGDGYPDYALYNAATHQTAIWYLRNNLRIGTAAAPTLSVGWSLVGVADFNGDGHADYALFNPTTHRTTLWYLNNNVYVGGNYGPTVPSGWALVAVGDFNGDGKPDYVLYNVTTHQTSIWHMDNNLPIGSIAGPTIPSGWSLVGIADFNRDGRPDYLLFNPTTYGTAIWYVNNGRGGGPSGPTIPNGWSLIGTADFNRDGYPDYLLFNPTTHATVIWYINGRVGGPTGPTIPSGWSLAAP